MTWIARRNQIPVAPRGFHGVRFCLIALGITCCYAARADAARMGRFLTSEDLAGRMVLDQTGAQIQLPSAGDRHPALAQGVTPTYLAIPLDGGEHLPISIPTIETGSQQGENPVGPLNFDTLVKTNLDTTLATSRLVEVNTPSKNYLVELLPRRSHGASSATNTVNDLSHLLNSGSSEFTKVTQGGVNDLEKFLHISSKSTTSKPSLNLEAQLLGGDAPAVVPEPSTWMVFSMLIAAGAIVRSRRRIRA
jgi:hypothetical protein